MSDKKDKKPLGDIIVDGKNWNRPWVNAFKTEKEFLDNKAAQNSVSQFPEKGRESLLKRIYAESKKS